MNFEIYCDESGLEALKNKDAHKFIAIGGIWIPETYRDEMKQQVNDIKKKFNIHGEFKWNKISPAYFDFYKSLIDYFFQTENIRFRVILIQSDKVNNFKFNNCDNELSFYKFYYQLINKWIYDFNEYAIFLDFKINRNKVRLQHLCKILSNSNLTSTIKFVQGLPSEQSIGIQLADILTGVVAAKFNNNTTSKAKADLIKHIEETYLKTAISPTPKTVEKFNVFRIKLEGGW